MVVGTLFICSCDARVLIDPGATHSFVSASFAVKLGRDFSLLDVPLTVATLLSQPVDVDLVYKGCDVIVDGHKLPIDLILLDVLGFDVVLGMD